MFSSTYSPAVVWAVIITVPGTSSLAPLAVDGVEAGADRALPEQTDEQTPEQSQEPGDLHAARYIAWDRAAASRAPRPVAPKVPFPLACRRFAPVVIDPQPAPSSAQEGGTRVLTQRVELTAAWPHAPPIRGPGLP